MKVYAPISGKNLKIDERVIYVLGCLTSTCGRNPCSWRAIRVQKLNPTDEEVVQETAVASSPVAGWNNDIWTEEGNDENDEDIDLEELGVALFEAASVASFSKKRHAKPTVKSSPLNAKPTVKSSPLSPGTRVVSNDTPVLPCFYTYTEEELTSREIKKEQIQKVVSNEEAYEYTGTWNADRTYFRFRKCLDAYPEQCFRYNPNCLYSFLMKVAYILILIWWEATSGYGRGRRPREMQALWGFNAL
ncbi:uncharacterized protein LOC117919368 [Vitis riparia]|uniref:uncharacterized protein LOC117919368 n=1 Tax=Vitis riparia TaxID=96939 RepID=UPI00155A34E0|nr:uncharacterized protein LOC117919368 [Vitis riparia]